jgi:integrase
MMSPQRLSVSVGGLEAPLNHLETAMLSPSSTPHRYVIAAPEAPPFNDLYVLWLAFDAERLRPNTRREYLRTMRKEVLPRIGDLRADLVKRLGLIELLRELKEENGPGVARSARAAISAVFNWAIAEGKVDCTNPTLGIKLPRPGKRERWLTADELRIVWHACENLGDYGRIIRLLILTGCRPDEIAALTWPEVNRAKAQLELPGSRVKNAHKHIVPLTALALAQLPEPRARGPFLFGPDHGERKFTGWAYGRKELPLRTGPLPGGHWTPHATRHTFSTHLRGDELKVPKEIVEACLNHLEPGMAGLYNHADYLPQRREVMERWSAFVAQIVGERAV